MAYYAALVSLVQLLEDIIHRDRYPNLLLDKRQIAFVHKKFSLLQMLLDDYSPKDREATDSLERRIRDAAYQAQDIIEFHISHQMRQCLLEKTQMPQQFQELDEVKEEVDSIVQELMRIKESCTIEDNLQLKYYLADTGTSNQASHKNTTMGFEEHLTTIKGELCGERSKLQVVAIAGMGGIGKTTTARNIFDDEFMKYHFDCRFWVTISQDYHLKKVLLDILDCMKITIHKSSEVAELGTTIYKYLQGRKYLIIMDDMWDTKVWDYMKSILPDDSNGSRIMITTRISDVALSVDRFGFYYQMEFLNEEQSWNLFCEKVFCPPELEDIGRLISKNCRGLPLAIVVVAGLLAKLNKTRCDWEEIARNVCSIAAENDEHFSKILSLSYNHLPHHLKPCFLYIGSFPEDYEIPISKLVKLWVAEGILKPSESKSLEAVAEEYLDNLVNRNLVLITKKGSIGKIKYCVIHDLLRDLCTKIISYENFLHVVRQDSCFPPIAARNVRRLYFPFHFYIRSWFREGEQFGSHVRSIIYDIYDWDFIWEVLSPSLGFKLCRVLDSIKGHGTPFNAKIFELFHLRYLSITVNEIPPSISMLQNLETLIIEFASWLKMSCLLPSEIREMPNLRHIVSSKKRYFKCQFFDERIAGEPSKLENLQTLSGVRNARFIDEVIKMIPNLQKLKVLYNGTHRAWQNFRLDNLSGLPLETLNIFFHNTWKTKVNPLPENFAFPLTLKKLSLRRCKLPWKDMMVLGSLHNLQVLKLMDDAFVGDKWELDEEKFQQLKFLLMQNLGLKYWQAECIHFPELQHLKISYCTELQDIPLEIGGTLELVEVNSNELVAKSALGMQQEQQNTGNDVLQVRVHSEYGSFRITNEVNEVNPNLRKLKILCDEEKAVEWQKFCLDNFWHLHRLESLNIEFRPAWRLIVNPLPERFCFPLALKKLSLEGCKIPWKDMTVVGSLCNLEVLKLRDHALWEKSGNLLRGNS